MCTCGKGRTSDITVGSMADTDLVAVFCDEEDETEIVSKLKEAATFPYRMYCVRNGPSVHRAVRELCAHRRSYRCALNLCAGSVEDERRASPAVVAALLGHCGIPCGGCPHVILKQPLDVLFMMCFYAGIVLPRFAVVQSLEDAASTALCVPVRVRGAYPLVSALDTIIEDAAALPAALAEAQRVHGRIVAWEINANTSTAAVTAVFTGAGRTVSDTGGADRFAAAFARDVLRGNGFARLRFNASPHSGECVLEDIVLNCALSGVDTGALRGLFAECVLAAVRDCRPPVMEVRQSHDARGYFVCAARDVGRGECVFEDEGASVAVVTRPFVERHWGPSERALFAEYAWPLDSDGHVYAIWDSDPMRWRPINHSCDPNCIFDEGHSLNVIAARPIDKGNELTMDYSTFCDGTMKPFQCQCGAACCRGLIVPDEVALRKYGTNTWHRRAPLSLT